MSSGRNGQNARVAGEASGSARTAGAIGVALLLLALALATTILGLVVALSAVVMLTLGFRAGWRPGAGVALAVGLLSAFLVVSVWLFFAGGPLALVGLALAWYARRKSVGRQRVVATVAAVLNGLAAAGAVAILVAILLSDQ